MTSEFLHDRERALEDSFFFQKDKELLGKLKQVSERNTEKSELKKASGISDDAVLEDLLDAGINAKTAASLSLVPLVLVAWADGVIQRQEREAIMKAAHEAGMTEGDSAYELLNSWLADQPDDSLFHVWREYIEALAKVIDAEKLNRLKEDIVSRTLHIAKAAGGFLGIGKVEASEKKVMKEIQSAFDVE
jgi:tellurite resistance protein